MDFARDCEGTEQLRWINKMEKTDNSYIAIDLETTGLNPKTERIIEDWSGAGGRWNRGADVFDVCQPGQELDARIRELTGICDDDLKDAPVLDTVLPELLAFCGELPLLGHHVIFDFQLSQSGRRSTGSIHLSTRGLDTFENLPPFYAGGGKEESAAACPVFCGGSGREPSALSDALAAHHLYQELKNRYFLEVPEVFAPQPLIYKVKREQPASKSKRSLAGITKIS